MKKNKKKFNTSFLFILPYALMFFTFVIVLIAISMLLSLTYFDTINFPQFIAFKNYVNLFTQDSEFMQYALDRKSVV